MPRTFLPTAASAARIAAALAAIFITPVLGLPAAYAAAPTGVASVAIEGTVMDRRSAWEGGLILTRSRVRVDRLLRGTAPVGAEVEVTELGGRVGDIAQVVHRQPVMPRGPRVMVELAPGGQSWRLVAVLAPTEPGTGAAAAPTELAAPGGYVRTTNKDSNPPCDGATKPVAWGVSDVHFVLDDACSTDVYPEECEAAVLASFQTWQDVECSYMSFSYDGRIVDAPLGYSRTGPNFNVVKWIEAGWPGSPDAQAITLATIGCTTGRQLDADIMLNGELGTFTVLPALGEGKADIQNTLTHEVGHFAGFAHAPDPESTMYVTADLDETMKRDLTADDVNGLCQVYPAGKEPEHQTGCACRAATPRSSDWDVLPRAALLALCCLALSRRRHGRGRS